MRYSLYIFLLVLVGCEQEIKESEEKPVQKKETPQDYRLNLVSDSVKGIQFVDSTRNIALIVNREKARYYQLSTAQIASSIRTTLFGADLSFNLDSANLEKLLQRKITFRNPKGKMFTVPIQELLKVDSLQ